MKNEQKRQKKMFFFVVKIGGKWENVFDRINLD